MFVISNFNWHLQFDIKEMKNQEPGWVDLDKRIDHKKEWLFDSMNLPKRYLKMDKESHKWSWKILGFIGPFITFFSHLDTSLRIRQSLR